MWKFSSESILYTEGYTIAQLWVTLFGIDHQLTPELQEVYVHLNPGLKLNCSFQPVPPRTVQHYQIASNSHLYQIGLRLRFRDLDPMIVIISSFLLIGSCALMMNFFLWQLLANSCGSLGPTLCSRSVFMFNNDIKPPWPEPAARPIKYPAIRIQTCHVIAK